MVDSKREERMNLGDIWELPRVLRELNGVPMNSLLWMKLHLLKVPPPSTAHTEGQASNTQSLKAHASHQQPQKSPHLGCWLWGVGVNSLLEIVSPCLCLSHTEPGLWPGFSVHWELSQAALTPLQVSLTPASLTAWGVGRQFKWGQ